MVDEDITDVIITKHSADVIVTEHPTDVEVTSDVTALYYLVKEDQ